jgi:hypothetical protein
LSLSGSPMLVRNTVLEYNNVGIICSQGANARIYNSIIAHNYSAGVRVYGSNPTLENNLLIFNHANGLWCDGMSKIAFGYNCVFGNDDGNLLDCDPHLGILSKVNKHKDSTDYRQNLFCDPMFQGSVAESLAVEHDVSLPTDKSRLRDTTLAKVLHGKASLPDSTAHRRRLGAYKRYSLSAYSPCVNAGNPAKPFNDDDGSRNDMGVWGGPESYKDSKKP